MTTFQQALQAIPYHLVAIIGRQHGLRFDSNLSKSELIDKVAPALLDPDHLSQTLARLSPPEHQCLFDLLLAGGRLPARHLTTQRNRPRTPRQLIQAHRQQIPLSPPEQLCRLGLLFYDPDTYDLFIPSNLIPHLPMPTLPPSAVLAATPTALAPIDLVCHDLTCLLALLQRTEVSLLHRCWLPPSFLTLWGQHCAVPPYNLTPRSELQTNRRRFIHYLAENAGLVNSNCLLTNDAHPKTKPQLAITNNQAILIPTPAAWLWLKAERDQRLQTLWQFCELCEWASLMS